MTDVANTSGPTPEAAPAQFRAVNPRTGSEIDPVYRCATPAEVDAAARAAWEAFGTYGALDPGARAALLDAAANELDEVRRPLVERAQLETGLNETRLGREFDRMTFTLRMFAQLVREGWGVRSAIDHPATGAEPGTIGANDVRRMLMPLGPVAVFGASNFPLAYGVAGGDTASALAAGCPVIVKGHPSHPGTGEMVAQAISRAAEIRRMEPGVFSYLPSGGAGEMRVGAALVEHPLVRAVGFTGSFAGGMALAELASKRKEPIPVFAEMGSTNPVFVLPGAAQTMTADIVERLAGSIVGSSGQMCTCPGLIFVIDSEGAREMVAALGSRLRTARDNVMLSRRVRDGYAKRLAACLKVKGVTNTPEIGNFARAKQPTDGPIVAPAGLMETRLATFIASETLREEVFGPAVLVVWCADENELLSAINETPGSLTASIFAASGDHALAQRMVPLLSVKAGRVVYNGVPTGVRVAAAMVHGGPFPSTNRPDTTAVGAFAIERWTRPVCFQNVPDSLLPPALREREPSAGPRLIDGRWTHEMRRE